MKTQTITLALAFLTTLAGCAGPIDDPDAGPEVDVEDVDEGEDGAEEEIAEARSALFSPGLYTIQDVSGGGHVDVEGASTEEGASVLLWSYHGGHNQVFRPVFHGAGGAALAEGQVIQLVARHSDKCLDVRYGSTSAGAPIIQWPCHDADNQRWTLATKPGVFLYGAYLLKSKKSGLCLRTSNGKLVQGACDSAAPLWHFEPSDAAPAPVGLHDLEGYGGHTLTFSGDVQDLRAHYPGNDMASSISLPFGLTVAVYSEPQLAGVCETITADVPDLSARIIGSNTISSMRFNKACP